MISAMEPVHSAPKMGDTNASKPMKVKINSRQAPASESQGQGRRNSYKTKEPKEKSPMNKDQQQGVAMQRDMLAQQNAMLLQQMAHLNQAFWCSQMQTAALVAKDMAAQTNPYASMYMQRPSAPGAQQGYIEQDAKPRRGNSKSRKNRRPSATMSPQNSLPMGPQTSMTMSAQGSMPMTPQASMLPPPGALGALPLGHHAGLMSPMAGQGSISPMSMPSPFMASQWSDVSTSIPFSPQSSIQSSFAGSRRNSLNNASNSRRGSYADSPKHKNDHTNSKQQKAVVEEKPQPQTTVMIRNLIETCTRQMLLDFLSQQGFEKQFDMVYLPLKFCSKLCFHYAFVNFVTEEVTKKFIKELQGFKGAEAFGEQACDISMSVDNQGLAAAIKRYRNSPVMHPSVPDECKPLIFKDGKPIPFPPPTKNIRKPRKDMGDVSKDAETVEIGEVSIAEEEQPKELERRSSFESQISEE